MLTTDNLQQLQDGNSDFFVYEIDFSAVTSGSTPQNSFTVQADSNFLWEHGCFFADIAAAAETNDSRVLPLITCVIADTSSGRQLMSNPVPITSLFGYASQPYELPYPRFFRANTQVTVSLTNFSAATDYNLKLQFIGRKFFKFQ